jgi:hypothetical protein
LQDKNAKQTVGALQSNSHPSNAQALIDIKAGKVGGEGLNFYTSYHRGHWLCIASADLDFVMAEFYGK